MNNPFSRLKHYTPEANDAQENHATECLAACLVFSEKLRRAFIDFLFASNKGYQNTAISRVDVDTQYPIQDGFIDLVLELPHTFVVAVEVKVKQREDAEQLKKYRHWLDIVGKSHGHLFTLVRSPDSAFHPDQYGVHARRTWLGLYKFIQLVPQQYDLSEVETSLLKYFGKYLESEGIVSTYDTKDLLAFSAGLKAQRALTGIFDQVSASLKDVGFEPVFFKGRDDYWPQLMIACPEWRGMFGKGKNQRIALWFMIPGVWEADRHDFFFSIELWGEEDVSQWQTTKLKLPKWFDTLKSKGLDWSVSQTWRRHWPNMPASEIAFIPKRIHAHRCGEERFLIQSQPQGVDDLVKVLIARTLEYADLVSSLND